MLSGKLPRRPLAGADGVGVRGTRRFDLLVPCHFQTGGSAGFERAYDDGMDGGWTLLAHYRAAWGGRFQRDVKLHHRGCRYLVRVRVGVSSPPMRAYAGTDLRDALEALSLVLAVGDRWDNVKAANDQSAAHMAAQSALRTAHAGT